MTCVGQHSQFLRCFREIWNPTKNSKHTGRSKRGLRKMLQQGIISISRQQLKASYLLRVCMMLDGPQSISGGCNYLCGDFTIGESPIPNDFTLFLKDCINTEPGADEESEGILAASAQLLLLLTNSHFCNNAPSLSNLTNRCQSLPI